MEVHFKANLIRLEKRLEEIESEANVLENPGLRAGAILF